MENKESPILLNIFGGNFRTGLLGGQKNSLTPRIYCVVCGEFARGNESEQGEGICFKCENLFEE